MSIEALPAAAAAFVLERTGGDHTVDGQAVTATVKDLEFRDLGPAFEGSQGQAKRLYVFAADLTGTYAPERALQLDGVRWDIAAVRNRGGLLFIDLYRNRL